MNIIEYLTKLFNGNIYMDGCGNTYVECPEYRGEYTGLSSLDGVVEIMRDEIYFIYKDVYEKYAEYKVIISDDDRVKNYSSPQRPYYHARGKPVTRE